ncbi:MAG TPA: zinc dependent phospholipase C family protein [Candidatus Binataceae bacterium]|nr:zinc dependent phospholipase C family protein [Candidatus Binataceae bacterium]
MCPPAHAWASRLHENIVSLAIQALPPSPLADIFSKNDVKLEQYAVEPDSVLKPRLGKSEEIKHYIDIELYRPGEFDALTPEYNEMVRKYGLNMLLRSGTLPWAIEDEAVKLRDAWDNHDCAGALRHAGYLAHYVADASQPLHSTIYYDGYPEDKGIHQRIERAADDNAQSLWRESRERVSATEIGTVWPAIITELRDAHSHVEELIQADRDARASAKDDQEQYDKLLIESCRHMFDNQIAQAASVLASIWIFEWKAGGSPDQCKP